MKLNLVLVAILTALSNWFHAGAAETSIPASAITLEQVVKVIETAGVTLQPEKADEAELTFNEKAPAEFTASATGEKIAIYIYGSETDRLKGTEELNQLKMVAKFVKYPNELSLRNVMVIYWHDGRENSSLLPQLEGAIHTYVQWMSHLD